MEVTMRPGKKPKQRGCGCGYFRGRPHYNNGPCGGMELRPAVKERYEGRKLLQRYSLAIDPDDVE